MPGRSTAAIACAELLALEVQIPTCGWLRSGRRRAAGWAPTFRAAVRVGTKAETPRPPSMSHRPKRVCGLSRHEMLFGATAGAEHAQARATDSTAPTMAVSITLPFGHRSPAP
jgi:hypothetical protein